MKPKIMISQPMRGKTNEQILEERKAIIKAIEDADGEYVDSILDLKENKKPLDYLIESLKKLNESDVIWFMPGWEKSRGCRIEFEIAKSYGKFIKCLPEEEYKHLCEIYNEKSKIKVEVKGPFENMDELIEKFSKDLEEMLNDNEK